MRVRRWGTKRRNPAVVLHDGTNDASLTPNPILPLMVVLTTIDSLGLLLNLEHNCCPNQRITMWNYVGRRTIDSPIGVLTPLIRYESVSLRPDSIP